MLLCFLLSRAILFPKEGKVSCHVVSPFLCACHHLTKVVEYLLSPSICHLFTWILHFLSRPTLYTLSDSISRLSLGQSVPCSCGRGTAIESWLPWGRISIDEIQKLVLDDRKPPPSLQFPSFQWNERTENSFPLFFTQCWSSYPKANYRGGVVCFLSVVTENQVLCFPQGFPQDLQEKTEI